MANNITLNNVTISLRADTLANWQTAQTAAGNSPIIASGEVVVVTDTFRIIRGDGVSKFETLYNSPLTYPTIHCNSKPTAGVVDGALYVDVTNNKFYLGTSSGAVEMSFTLNAASSTALGGIKIGYGVNGRNYPVQLNSASQAFVTVPWIEYSKATGSSDGLMSKEDKTKLNNIEEGANNYTLPVATDSARGGIKVGYSTSGRNYAVQLENEKAYVNVPWIEYSAATDTTLGLIKTGYTASGRNYPVKLSNGNAYVNVPWVNSSRKLVVASTPNKLANEVISGTGSNTLYINLVKDGNAVESSFSITDNTPNDDNTKRLFNIISDGNGGIFLTPNTTYITNEFSSLQQQINEARDIAQGKTNTWVFDAEAPSEGFPSWLTSESDIYKTYYNMISQLLAHSSMIGENNNIIKFSDNLLLLPVDTPDFWVSGAGPKSMFSDANVSNLIITGNAKSNIERLISFANGIAPYVYIGYADGTNVYRLSKLETRKINLTPYQKELMESPLGEDENGEPIGAYVEPAIHYTYNLLLTTRTSLSSLTDFVNTISGDLTGVMQSITDIRETLTTIDETLDEHASDISGLQASVTNLTNEDTAIKESISGLRTTINNNAAADTALAGRVTTLENTVVYKTDTITISGGGAAR